MGIFSRRRHDDGGLPAPATHTYGSNGTNGLHNDTYNGTQGYHNNPVNGMQGSNDHTLGGSQNFHNNTSNNTHGFNNGPVSGQHGHHSINGDGRNGYYNDSDNGRNGFNKDSMVGHHDRNHGYHREERSLFQRRNHDRRNKQSRPLFDLDSGTLNRRPSFGQWLKMTWLDLLTMAAMGAVGLGVYNADPAPSRSFPITFSDGEIVFPDVAYPMRKEIVPIWLAALLASLIPIFIILMMQIRIRSFWDVNNAVIGLLYSLITAALFQVFIKWLIGGLRPHFLAVCDPDPSLVAAAEGQGNGFKGIMFDRSVCRGDRAQINDALESMPSGHSTAAFAGFIYLYFYLNAKLKVFSNYHPAMWKLIVTYAPVLGACLIAGAMCISEYHHWYDVTAGAIIGTIMATSAYRMTYASCWDFRFNHIPLMRDASFTYGGGAAGAAGFETAVFTRKGGWGYEEAFGGAPNDAAYHLRGQAAGFNAASKEHHTSKEGGMLGHGHGHGHHDTNTHTHANEHAHMTNTQGYGNSHGHVPADDVERQAAAHHDQRMHDDVERQAASVPGHNGLASDTHKNNNNNNNNLTTGTTQQPGSAGAGQNWGYPEETENSNRYRMHRKSIERKAVVGH
jgi:diacylglycerol diphosphate phosphatase / phosphatidate phosphatase